MTRLSFIVLPTALLSLSAAQSLGTCAVSVTLGLGALMSLISTAIMRRQYGRHRQVAVRMCSGRYCVLLHQSELGFRDSRLRGSSLFCCGGRKCPQLGCRSVHKYAATFWLLSSIHFCSFTCYRCGCSCLQCCIFSYYCESRRKCAELHRWDTRHFATFPSLIHREIGACTTKLERKRDYCHRSNR